MLVLNSCYICYHMNKRSCHSTLHINILRQLRTSLNGQMKRMNSYQSIFISQRHLSVSWNSLNKTKLNPLDVINFLGITIWCLPVLLIFILVNLTKQSEQLFNLFMFQIINKYIQLTFQGTDVVAPEFGLVGEAGILSIQIEMHFA